MSRVWPPPRQRDPGRNGTAHSKPVTQVVPCAMVLPVESEGHRRDSHRHDQRAEQKQQQTPLQYLGHLRPPSPDPRTLLLNRVFSHGPKDHSCCFQHHKRVRAGGAPRVSEVYFFPGPVVSGRQKMSKTEPKSRGMTPGQLAAWSAAMVDRLPGAALPVRTCRRPVRFPTSTGNYI